jgi:GT2 family glycosyltransferase
MIVRPAVTSPSRPRVTAIVLNYQHSADTLRCMRSVAKSTHLNLVPIVVDNGSDLAELEYLAAELSPGVCLIETGENLGYAAGNNVAIRQALKIGTDYVWVLNPDTTVEPETVEWMVRTAEQNENIGIVGSRVFYGGSDPLAIWFNGAAVDLESGGAADHQDMGKLDADVPAHAPFQTGYVTGTSMMIRTGVFESVGLLPEDYFLYFEETAFNIDVQRAGWATVVEPRSRVHHYKRSTGTLPTAAYMYYYVRNRLIFGQRYTTATTAETEAGLEAFIRNWRARVGQHAPEWVETFDTLVDLALTDGRALRAGYRDLTAMGSPRDIEAVRST